MKPTVSFLIAAHNEEKVISRALESIKKIPFSDYEVIVGLDGCTDGTKEICEKYDFVKIFESERIGKSEMIERLQKLAKGKIIMSFDADWEIFCKKGQMENLVKAFEEDEKLGGIIYPEFFKLRVNNFVEKIDNIFLVGDTWITKFLIQFRIENYTKKMDGKKFVNWEKGYPFMVNIWKNGLIDKIKTVNDDAEISIQILKKGFKIFIANEKEFPYISPYHNGVPQQVGFLDLLKQKTRDQFGSIQIQKIYKLNISHFYLKFLKYIFFHLHEIKKSRLKSIAGIFCYFFLIALATINARILYWKGLTTKEMWGLKVKRNVN